MPKDVYKSKDEPTEDVATSVTIKTEPIKDLLAWTAPARPFKRRTRDFYVTVVAMAALVGLILFFVDGFMPVLMVISVVFLYYVMSTVEPENIEYKITNKGIKIGDNLTEWPFMGRFWFTHRFSSDLLVVETARFPGRMEMVILGDDKDKITKALSPYLIHEEIPASSLDKAASWVSKRLPS